MGGKSKGTAARDVGARSLDPRTVFGAWLLATPALDRIDFVDVRVRPDGEPRTFGEMRNHPMDGFVAALRKERT